MTKYWSPERTAFLDDALLDRYQAAGTWPDDAIPVSDEVHATYSAAAPTGKVLGNAGGGPGWVDAPPRFTDAAAAERAIVRHIDVVTRQITGLVPDDEKTSWPVKAAAAHAFQADAATADQTAMLAAEAAETGETVDELAGFIVGRSQQYAAAIAPLTGIRRRALRDLADAGDAAGIEAVFVSAIDSIDTHIAAVLAAQQGA